MADLLARADRVEKLIIIHITASYSQIACGHNFTAAQKLVLDEKFNILFCFRWTLLIQNHHAI
jgi:hypothetical protein